MPFAEAIRLAVESIRTSLLRSFFTLLGIIVSVWLNPMVATIDNLDHKILFNIHREATQRAIHKAMQGEPSIDWLLENQERRMIPIAEHDIKRVRGGMLVQDRDWDVEDREGMEVATGEPSEAQWGDLLFAARVCKHVASNAIVIAKDLQTIGIGAGQMSRVDAVRLALEKAREHGHSLEGASLASDAFFPFPDGPQLALDAGLGLRRLDPRATRVRPAGLLIETLAGRGSLLGGGLLLGLRGLRLDHAAGQCQRQSHCAQSQNPTIHSHDSRSLVKPVRNISLRSALKY